MSLLLCGVTGIVDMRGRVGPVARALESRLCAALLGHIGSVRGS